MTAHYDDPKFSYDKYWKGREYEHECEILAIKHFLGSQHFSISADIGGGFGRLTSLLSNYSDKTVLVEPSIKQRQLAAKYLDTKKIQITNGTVEKSRLASNQIDCVLMVRVSHHLPEPLIGFNELFRILRPGGILVLEFANSLNFKARIKSFFTGQPILQTPIEKRSLGNIKKNTITFVNHHPHTINKYLKKAGFITDTVLSVSNFRSPFFKKFISHKLLLKMEQLFQPLLSSIYFGPSIFILAHKPQALSPKT